MDDGLFEVGLPVSIEIDYKYYLTTHIIGWEQDLYFLTGIAHAGSKSAHLKVNKSYKIRFLKEGTACGFASTLLAINLLPYPMIVFRYPAAIEQVSIRKFNRIKTDLAAQLLDQNGTLIANTTIKDISEGGCGLTVPAAQAAALAHDREYQLSFSFLDTNLRLPCSIRKMKTGRETSCLGIEFHELGFLEKEQVGLLLDVCANVFSSRIDSILAKMKASGESLSGHIEELSVTDILQIIDQMKKDGVLHIITQPHNGYIAIGKGRIMDVFMDDLQGEDALAKLVSLKEGLFHFTSKEIPPGRFRKPLQLALMDACRLLDERESLGSAFPAISDGLVLLKDPDSDDPEVQTIVHALQNGASNVIDLHAATGLSLIRCGLIAARLIKDGFLLNAF